MWSTSSACGEELEISAPLGSRTLSGYAFWRIRFREKTCDGSHTHKPWGVSWKGSSYSWNTAEEAEYPAVLCVEVAQAARKAALELCAFETFRQTCKPSSNRQLQAAAVGRQPRGNRFPEVFPEFKYTFDTAWTSTNSKVPRTLTAAELAEKHIPTGKLLSVISGEKSGESVAKIGVYRNSEEFVARAMKL